MTKYIHQAGERVPYMSQHLGGTVCVPNGGTVTLTLPTNTNMIYFKARGGAAYYGVNSSSQGTAAPGYVPQDNTDIIFACDNLGTVKVFAAASVYVHIQYYDSVG